MLHRRLLTMAGSLTLLLGLAATNRADDIVLIANSTVKAKEVIGGRLRGDIQSESLTEAKIKVANSVVAVPLDQIASINYTGAPASAASAESKETAGLLSEAADLYKKAVAEAAGKPFPLQAAQFAQARVTAEMALGDPSKMTEAISLLESFVRANPTSRHSVAAYETLARLQLKKADYAGVEKTVSEMEKLPQSADRAAVLRAKVLANKGEHDKAIAALDGLIKNSAEGSVRQRESRLAKAESLAALKKYPEAEKEAKAVVKALPPEDVQGMSAAYNTLGDCLRAAGKPKDALLAYLRTDILYSKDKEQHPRALAHIAELWDLLKQDGRAADVRQRLMAEYPQSPWTKASKAPAPAPAAEGGE